MQVCFKCLRLRNTPNFASSVKISYEFHISILLTYTVKNTCFTLPYTVQHYINLAYTVKNYIWHSEPSITFGIHSQALHLAYTVKHYIWHTQSRFTFDIGLLHSQALHLAYSQALHLAYIVKHYIRHRPT